MASKLKIIPLGGVGEIGKNMTVVEYGKDMIVVDCGLSFPDDDMPGIDLVIPDMTYLEKNLEKLRGFLITHGHEDHIGALPFALQKLDVPVYFLIGRHDVNAPVKLVEEYLAVLEAPHKEIVWFEHSGHTPWVTEADEFVRVLAEKVLKENP